MDPGVEIDRAFSRPERTCEPIRSIGFFNTGILAEYSLKYPKWWRTVSYSLRWLRPNTDRNV
jgi:hypothetical protein